VNHINKPTRYAANLQTPKTPDSVIALAVIVASAITGIMIPPMIIMLPPISLSSLLNLLNNLFVMDLNRLTCKYSLTGLVTGNGLRSN